MQIATSGLLVIQNRKLLLAFSRNKQCFYLPGGRLAEGETPEQGLCREIAEELAVQLQPAALRFYCHVTALAYGEREGTIMEQDCFFTTSTIHPQPSAEIETIAYFTLQQYLNLPTTAPGVVMILEKLTKDNLIDYI